MKVQFSLTREFVPTWNDNRDLPAEEQIKATLKTLESMDLLELSDAFERQGVKGEVDTDTMKPEDIKILLSETGRLLPKYVTITGLDGDDGPVSLDSIVTYPDFMPLAIELLMELANISQPTEADLKN
ncbi:MAG: hypothetical protein V3S55_03815 [Nitrospiraceae bacterium]